MGVSLERWGIPWSMSPSCPGSRPHLNGSSLFWERLASSPPMSERYDVDHELLHQCRYKINVHKQTKSSNISFQSSILLWNIVFLCLFVYLKHYVRRYEASSYSTIHWVQASCCTGSRPRLNVESLLWELLATSPPMADDEEILPDVMDLLLWMQVQMYTNKLNLPIKTSGHGISYILLHIGFSSTFVCLN